MFKELKEMKKNFEMLNGLRGQLNDFDMSDPQSMMNSIGIDESQLEEIFGEAMKAKKVTLNYTNESENKNPDYAYKSDSGFDLRSTEEIWIQANDRKLIPTGLKFDIPDGYEIQVRSKSGLALNQGLMVLNSPGTVDSGYQGEVKVIIFNTTNERIKIEKGQKIAQAVLCPVVSGNWVNLVKVEELGQKDRNDNGFGSTGL